MAELLTPPNVKARLLALMLAWVQRYYDNDAVEVIGFEDRSESWAYSSYTAGTDYMVDVEYRTSEYTRTATFSGNFSYFLNKLIEIEEGQ